MSDDKIEIEILEWNAVAVWKWDNYIENCAICKTALSEKCPQCGDFGAQECQPLWGVCKHPYHQHCIESWLKQSALCPLCNLAWQSSNQQNFKKLFYKP